MRVPKASLVRLGLLAVSITLSSALQVYPNGTAPPVSTDLPSSWKYQGCYTDSPQFRTLDNVGTSSNTSMTARYCIDFCTTGENDYSYAALSYGEECYCGHSLASVATKTNETECNFVCTGDDDQACGGSDRVSVFWNGASPPVINPGRDGWSSGGCFNDTPLARVLTGNSVSSNSMSVAICLNFCHDRNQKLAGLEYGRECYCGNVVAGVSVEQVQDRCNFPCLGNHTEWCGGRGMLNLYRYNSAVKVLVGNSIWIAMVAGWTIWLAQ